MTNLRNTPDFVQYLLINTDYLLIILQISY